MYDPQIGRFVQADPVVDDGLDGQAYNRYSYVTNNPLRYTDPSGYRRSGQARSAGVALFALIVFNIAAPGSMPPWLWASLQGATVGAVGTGTSSGAAWGAVSALAFHGIGGMDLGPKKPLPFSEMIQNGDYWAKVAVHAAAGGTLTELQGGRFGHGFVTAGVSAGASPLIDTIGGGRAQGRPARIVVQALVGGVVSKGMGGDFGSGALLAAIGRVMNAESALNELEQERATRRALYADQAQAVDDMKQRSSEYGDFLEEGYYLAVPVPAAKLGVLGRLKRWLGFGDEAARAVSVNKLNHVFGNSAHRLDDLVLASGGSQQAAYLAVQDAANAALRAGELVVGRNGVLPGGQLGAVLNVNGVKVQLVGGRVINGQVEIGSFSRRFVDD